MHFSVVRGAVGGFGSSTARLVLLWFCAVGSAPLGLSRRAQSRLALRVKSAPRALRFALSLRSLPARSRVARPRALGLSLCVARGRSGSRKRGTPPACLASLLSPRSVLLRGRLAPSPSQLRYSSALAPLRSILVGVLQPGQCAPGGWAVAQIQERAPPTFGNLSYFFYYCGIISKSIAYVCIYRAFQVLFRLAVAVAGAGRCAVIRRALVRKKPGRKDFDSSKNQALRLSHSVVL